MTRIYPGGSDATVYCTTGRPCYPEPEMIPMWMLWGGRVFGRCQLGEGSGALFVPTPLTERRKEVTVRQGELRENNAMSPGTQRRLGRRAV